MFGKSSGTFRDKDFILRPMLDKSFVFDNHTFGRETLHSEHIPDFCCHFPNKAFVTYTRNGSQFSRADFALNSFGYIKHNPGRPFINKTST